MICTANALDGESNTVFAGIEYAVLTGAVVLELQHHIAVVKAVNVLGLAFVNLLHSSETSLLSQNESCGIATIG